MHVGRHGEQACVLATRRKREKEAQGEAEGKEE